MQGLILTAGDGTRLRPLTLDTPKCLIPIAGKAILDHQLESLWSAGAHRVSLVTGAHADKVEQHTKRDHRIQTVFNGDYKTTNVLYSFSLGLEALKQNEDLIVLAGDVVFERPLIGRLISKKQADLVLCVNHKQCREEEVKVILNEGVVERMGKNLEPSVSYGEFLGIFYVSAVALPLMRKRVYQMMASGHKGGYLFDMINALIAEDLQSASIFEVNDLKWEEIDFPEDVQRAAARFS